MTLSRRISSAVALFLFFALVLSSAAFIVHGYLSYKNEAKHEAESVLEVFKAMHIQAMLNRGSSKDNDPAIATFDGAMAQLSRNSERYALWAVMAPKVISFQKRNGHEDLELPQDEIDRKATRTGKTIGRMDGNKIYRLTVPVVLGQGDADHPKCFECHGSQMGIQKGEVLGAYSISLAVGSLWAGFVEVVELSVVATILSLSLIAFVSHILLNRWVSRPIESITEKMKLLADGKVDIDLPKQAQENEIGSMAQALEVFRQNARELYFQKLALDEHAIVSSTDVKGNITYVNDKFCEISGYSRDELIGQNHRFIKSDEHSSQFYEDLWRTVAHGRVWNGNVKNLKKNGEEYWVSATIVPFTDSDGKPIQYISIRTDITDQKKSAKLKVMAYHDTLTGLPNRALFSDRLLIAIAQGKRLDAQTALLYLDLDKFKPINDELGHDAGDEVLKEVARRLKGLVRETDTVARIGGDEFAIVMAPPVPTEVCHRTAENIIAALSEPINALGQNCYVGVSIGISCFPNDAIDMDELVRRADMAMYRVKDRGRNGYEFYSKETE